MRLNGETYDYESPIRTFEPLLELINKILYLGVDTILCLGMNNYIYSILKVIMRW